MHTSIRTGELLSPRITTVCHCRHFDEACPEPRAELDEALSKGSVQASTVFFTVGAQSRMKQAELIAGEMGRIVDCGMRNVDC